MLEIFLELSVLRIQRNFKIFSFFNFLPVPKVASSSISEVIIPFLKEIKSPSENFSFPQAEVWARTGRLENMVQVNSTNTFLVARHPLVRIASAYRQGPWHMEL